MDMSTVPMGIPNIEIHIPIGKMDNFLMIETRTKLVNASHRQQWYFLSFLCTFASLLRSTMSKNISFYIREAPR